jgi:hypothetical protein
MARVYYIRGGSTGTPTGDGEELGIDEVIDRFRGHRKVSLGPTPPALQSGFAHRVQPGKRYVVIEVGPDEVRPPDFLDIGFYLIG